MSPVERVWMTFPDGGRGQVAVTPLGGGRFRLEETPLLYVEEVYFGDEIDTDRDADGALRFRGVVSRSSYRTYSWLLSQSLAASRAMAEFRDVRRVVHGPRPGGQPVRSGARLRRRRAGDQVGRGGRVTARPGVPRQPPKSRSARRAAATPRSCASSNSDSPLTSEFA
jgi:hypothetical protein